MCFSATSSFIAAAVTGAIGVVAISRVERREDILLAATPLFFAGQQVIEGLLWLNLPDTPSSPTTARLTLTFLLFAKVFWPTFAPVAAYLTEPDPRRRSLIGICVFIGLGVGAYFVWLISSNPQVATITTGHIAYASGPEVPLAIGVAYFIATVVAPAMSSHWPLRLFAAIVAASSIVTYVMFWDAFSSIWCFFAAFASAVIVFHFERQRQLRQAIATP